MYPVGQKLFPALALLLALTLTVACDRSRQDALTAGLDVVEQSVNKHPGDALEKLAQVDSSALTTRALRARYALLRTMALDKNYQDITVPGLLDDEAVRWYERHGSADEKMKVYHYLGRIEQDKNNYNEAAVLFARAESFAGSVTDKHALGLLYVAEGALYGGCYNTEKEKEYYEKALDVLAAANDPIYNSVLGSLAKVYHAQKDWHMADSLYSRAIAHSDAFPFAQATFLSHYACMKVQQPDRDPAGAIALLDRKREIFPLDVKEAGAYAYALALQGDRKGSDAIRQQLENLEGTKRINALPWLLRLATLRGDYRQAFRYQREERNNEDEIINFTLRDPVNQTLRDYYELASQQERARRLQLSVWAMVGLVLLLSGITVALLRERRTRDERDRLIAIRGSLEQELQEQERRTEHLSSDLSSRVEQLRAQLNRDRLEKLRKNGKYGYWMWLERNDRYSDKEIVRALRKDLREVCVLEKDYHTLEQRIDQELGGLLTQLKKDLELDGKQSEERFLCFWLIDLKPDMIAELLDITTNNVYVKTHRLENRIRNLGKPEYSSLIKG